MPRRYQVVVLAEAESEAHDAAEYIAKDSPQNGARWYAGLERAIESLALFPHRCAMAPEARYLRRKLRHFIFKSHRLIFEIDERKRRVRILHVRHAARRAIGEPEEGDG